MTTTDHKKIGILYVINSFLFFFIGGILALLVRTELAVPELQFVTDQTYNELFTMHATLMIFLFVIPMLAGFGNYVVPLQIGAPDMAFPRINALSFWMLPLGGLLILLGFVTGGAAAAGWTSLQPAGAGPPIGLGRVGPGPLDRRAGARRHELDPGRGQLPRHDLQDAGARDDAVPDVAADLDRPRDRACSCCMATPVFTSAMIMLFIDRNLGGSFFDPANGGDAILYQNIFWFYSHPAVYVMILHRDGHGQRDPARLQPQTAVRLQGVRLRDGRHRGARVLGVGAPHVHDRRGLPAVLQPDDVPDRGPDRA